MLLATALASFSTLSEAQCGHLCFRPAHRDACFRRGGNHARAQRLGSGNNHYELAGLFPQCTPDLRIGAMCEGGCAAAVEEPGQETCLQTKSDGTVRPRFIFHRTTCPHDDRFSAWPELALVMVAVGMSAGCAARCALVRAQHRLRGTLLPTSGLELARAEIACGVPVLVPVIEGVVMANEELPPPEEAAVDDMDEEAHGALADADADATSDADAAAPLEPGRPPLPATATAAAEEQ
jgi:hypothetical protein